MDDDCNEGKDDYTKQSFNIRHASTLIMCKQTDCACVLFDSFFYISTFQYGHMSGK